MECIDCSKITRDGFEKEKLFGEKKTRYESVFYMLNIPHHIRSSGYYYCYCDKKKEGKCKICAIPVIFSNFKKDIERNMFDVDFLNSCYGKFSHELMELFDENKSCIDCLLHHEYTFSGGNWNTGETWSVPVSLKAFDTTNELKSIS